MSVHKRIDRICVIITIATLILTLAFMNGSVFGLMKTEHVIGYEERVFDTTRVHSIEIVMDDWDSFIASCEDEEYRSCSVVIDGENMKKIAIRAKGNTSLSSVAAMGGERYSFKLEFDHYDSGKTYHGLDKLCLNNLISDNTFMKDYLAYRMMDEFGVDAPLCSYAYVKVNGSDFGLFLAVEGVEESFLDRNYGDTSGNIYKPESMGMGGMGSSDVKLQYIDDKEDSYLNLFESAKTTISDRDKTRLIESLKKLGEYEDLESVLDTDEVMRYMIVHNYTVNGDSYTGSMIHNYYLCERNGKLSMIPWDYNLAFSSFQMRNAGNGVNSPIDDVLEDRPMQAWIFSDEDYTMQYHQLYREFMETVDPQAIIEETKGIIGAYVESDPTKFCSTEEYEDGVKALSEFCKLRTESVSSQLSGTIPSTSEGQAEDDSSLVDDSNLNSQAMGSMGGMRGMRDMNQPEGMELPEGMDFPEGRNFPEDMEFPEGMDFPEGMNFANGERFPENMQRNMGFGRNGQNQGELFGSVSEGEKYLLLGISVVFLLAGILVALKYRQ